MCGDEVLNTNKLVIQELVKDQYDEHARSAHTYPSHAFHDVFRMLVGYCPGLCALYGREYAGCCESNRVSELVDVIVNETLLRVSVVRFEVPA